MKEKYYILNMDDIEVYSLNYDEKELNEFSSKIRDAYKIPQELTLSIISSSEELDKLLCDLNLMDEITKYSILKKEEYKYQIKIFGYNYPIIYHILNNNKKILLNENMSAIEAIYRWQNNQNCFNNLRQENIKKNSNDIDVYDPMIENKNEIVEQFFTIVSLDKTNSYNKEELLNQLKIFLNDEKIEEKYGNIQDEAIKNYYIINKMLNKYADFGHQYSAVKHYIKTL